MGSRPPGEQAHEDNDGHDEGEHHVFLVSPQYKGGSATTSTTSDLAPPPPPIQCEVQDEEQSGPRPDQIQATTTIAETYWRRK